MQSHLIGVLSSSLTAAAGGDVGTWTWAVLAVALLGLVLATAPGSFTDNKDNDKE